MSSTLVPSASASQGFDASSSASSAPQLGSVYVGDLNPDVTEKDLLDVFKTCGNVRSVRIPRDLQSNKSLCYGYVNFDSMEAANKAVTELNGVRIRGKKPCRVMHQEHDSSKRNSPDGKIFVKGLKDEVDTRTLQGFMSQYGDIYSCVVKTDAEGASLGYGFCQFQNPADSKKAIEDTSDRKPALGEECSVCAFLPPDQRPSSRDRYTNVYIKGFDRFATEQVVKDLFKDCGEVTSWFFPEGPSAEEDGAGGLRGFCFANFKDHETAHKVVAKFETADPIVWVNHVPQDAEASKKMIEEHPDGKYPEGVFVGKIFASRAMSKDERIKLLSKDHPKNFPAVDEKRCVFVRGVQPDMTEEDLVEFFSKFGELDTIMRGDKQVPNVHIPRNKETGNSIRGFAYVTFKSAEDCSKACANIEGVCKGHRLQINLATSKNARKMMELSGAGPQGAGQMFMLSPAQLQMQLQMYYAMASGILPFGMSYSQNPHFNLNDFHQHAGGAPVFFGNSQKGFPFNVKHGNGNANRTPRGRNNNSAGRGARGRNNNDSKDRRNGPNNQSRGKGMAHEATAPKAGEVTSIPSVPAPVPEPVEVSAPADAETSPEELKQRLGEKIYERVMTMYENDEPRWGKLTGMLIESIEPNELQRIVDDEQKLDDKIREANKFYEDHVNRSAEADQ